jgi:hypothetical protein
MPLVIKHSNPEIPDEEIGAPYEALEKAKKPLGWIAKLKYKLKKK